MLLLLFFAINWETNNDLQSPMRNKLIRFQNDFFLFLKLKVFLEQPKRINLVSETVTIFNVLCIRELQLLQFISKSTYISIECLFCCCCMFMSIFICMYITICCLSCRSDGFVLCVFVCVYFFFSVNMPHIFIYFWLCLELCS